jgi:hypothetical protein
VLANVTIRTGQGPGAFVKNIRTAREISRILWWRKAKEIDKQKAQGPWQGRGPCKPLGAPVEPISD